MISSILVDDNPHDLELFKDLIKAHCPHDINIIAEAQNLEDAHKKIIVNNPQLVFLDIEMGKHTGFDLLEKFSEFTFRVIFVTAYDKYAIKAIQFNALDYLLKPVEASELARCVKKIKETLAHSYQDNLASLIHSVRHPYNMSNPLAIPVQNGLIMIPVEKIVYCEAMSEYTNFHLTDRRIICSSRSLGEYEDMLSDYNFFRVHHSFIASKMHIQKYIKGEGGELIMYNNASIPVSKRRKKGMLEWVTGK